MFFTTILIAASALAPAEGELNAKLPDVFAKSAAHYLAIDAACDGHTVTNRDLRQGNAISRQIFPHGYFRDRRAYDMRSVNWWTSGHFAGSFWYLYEATDDAKLRDRATWWTERLAVNATADSNHDLGFIMNCSFGNARRLLNTDKYDHLFEATARTLARRYSNRLGLIRSWGRVDDAQSFLVIPDNMMNLELMEVASRLSGESRFAAIARSHADKSMENHFRDDGGCYHVLNYDQRRGFEGSVMEIRRGQGLSCRTAWSRGQSWGIYGYTMMYRMTGHRPYLDFACKLADYAMNHPRMPADGVPLWDFGARPDEERDSSAASCMASALLELSTFLDAERGGRYRAFAVKQLLALTSREYFSNGDEIGHFLLKHGVGSKPKGSEVDTPLVYGDYYFLEALLRFRRLVRGETVTERPGQ